MWRHCDAETVLVGLQLDQTLDALGWEHTQSVDLAIMTAKQHGRRQEGKIANAKKVALTELSTEFLGREIEEDVQSAVDDAFTLREIVLMCVEFPEVLKAWKRKENPRGPDEGKNCSTESRIIGWKRKRKSLGSARLTRRLAHRVLMGKDAKASVKSQQVDGKSCSILLLCCGVR